MKIAGVILIVLQCISLFGALMTGELVQMFTITGVRSAGNLVGYFLLGIIGVILLIAGIKKEKKKEQEM